MVSSRQQLEIQKRMKAIKRAKNNGESEKVIEAKTQELYVYLASEGLINP